MDWKIKQRDRVYNGHFKVDLFTIQHELFNGGLSKELVRERVSRQNSVGVLPYDPNRDEIVLIEQFRMGPVGQDDNPWMIEIIAGLVEEGENFEQVAYREAIEEANCNLQNLEHMVSFYPSPGGFSEKSHVYVAKVDTENLSGIYGAKEEGEDIRVKVVACEDAFDLLKNGMIRSAIPMIALLQFKSLRQELRSKWAGKD